MTNENSKPTSMTTCSLFRRRRRKQMIAGFLFSILASIFQLRQLAKYFNETTILDYGHAVPNLNPNPKTTVAYAISVTKFDQGNIMNQLMDRAAVLHQSIKTAMQRSSKYDYHIYAFVHPDAKQASTLLRRLGYRVQLRDTPFDWNSTKTNANNNSTRTTTINPELVEAQGNGCCGEKEYLKLYSYVLSDYPVVVHLDLDTIVLRPMDDLFDIMTMPTTTTTSTHTNTNNNNNTTNKDNVMMVKTKVGSFVQTSTMLMKEKHDHANSSFTYSLSKTKKLLENSFHHDNYPSLNNNNDATTAKTDRRINFMFTRDYNMVNPQDPPWKRPHQIGVQGGFLVVRPNHRDFNRMIQIILEASRNNYTVRDGWGGSSTPILGYGGYYGAGTIQGLASFYYDYYEHARRSIELNRCRYNTMVDNPHYFDKESNQTLCRTTEAYGDCEDCRETNLRDIYTAHFTVCGKPEWCNSFDHENHQKRLCSQLMREWHMARFSLELKWGIITTDNITTTTTTTTTTTSADGNDNTNSTHETQFHDLSLKSLQQTLGHCDGGAYIPLRFPDDPPNNNYEEEVIL